MKLMGAEFHFRSSVSDSCCCARWLAITNGLVGHLNGTGPSLMLLVTAALFFFFFTITRQNVGCDKRGGSLGGFY